MHYSQVSEGIEKALTNPPVNAAELARLRRAVKVVVGDSEAYFILGKAGDYLAIPRLFCSCKDFEINVVMRGKRSTCYHLVALELMLREGSVREVRIGIDEFIEAVFESVYEGRSRTLRKLLLVSAGGGSSPL